MATYREGHQAFSRAAPSARRQMWSVMWSVMKLKMDRIFKPPFYERRYIASAPSLSIAAELSKTCSPVGVLDGRIGGGVEIAAARGAGDHTARSNSERAAPSACV